VGLHLDANVLLLLHGLDMGDRADHPP